MMERRAFVGSMLAIFTGLAMPAPVREAVWVWPAGDVCPWQQVYGGARGGGKDVYTAIFRQYYYLGITPRNRVLLTGIVEPTQSVKVAQGRGVLSLAAAPPGIWG